MNAFFYLLHKKIHKVGVLMEKRYLFGKGYHEVVFI